MITRNNCSEFGVVTVSLRSVPTRPTLSIQHPTKEENIMIKRILIALLAATLMIIAGTGCKHTAHGVGEDVEKMGEKIQEKTK